ncbi:MAG: glycosyltransferase family 4 protein [Clostridiales bacterium]|nr:glycosyltransferase family 4 protein [Clostridiales bacterium]
MNILMLAPEPFFEPRGTPISVYFRIMALGELGYSVTLLTYPLGQDVHLKGLKIARPPNLFLTRRVKIGPSLMKIPLDLLLLIWAVRELARRPYDLIFSHEEAALLGVILARIWQKPHIYDMHSSLPQQLENFEFTRSPLILSLFQRIERFILRNSQVVIVICHDLKETVKRLGEGNKAFLLENFIDFPAADYSQEELAEKKRAFAPCEEKIILYAGNFEPYQGIPLLLRAARLVEARAKFLLVGGSGKPLEEMKKLAQSLGLSEKVIFLDKVPPSKVSFYIDLADVLVSPRLSGTNTPLKIYSWLKSGKPIVATDLWTHTQVLSREQAILVAPDPQSLARGIEFALKSPEAMTRAQAAREWAEREFTPAKYLQKMALILEKASSRFQERG